MEDNSSRSIERRVRVLLSVQRALVGAVTAHLRAVKVGWDDKTVQLYFIYDGEISEDDQEESECAATEVLASFPDDDVTSKHIRCDYPERLPMVGQIMVFQRKE